MFSKLNGTWPSDPQLLPTHAICIKFTRLPREISPISTRSGLTGSDWSARIRDPLAPGADVEPGFSQTRQKRGNDQVACRHPGTAHYAALRLQIPAQDGLPVASELGPLPPAAVTVETR